MPKQKVNIELNTFELEVLQKAIQALRDAGMNYDTVLRQYSVHYESIVLSFSKDEAVSFASMHNKINNT